MTTADRRSITSKSNAQRSTGPKTQKGKAATRLNAMRHGIYSEVCFIEGESEADLVAFGKCQRRRDFAAAGRRESASRTQARRPPISGAFLLFAPYF
jgi:hypothetical protein